MEVQAGQAVREELALEALFREKGFEITDEDIETEIADLASSDKGSVEETRKRWEELGLMSVLREQIMHRKAMLWLLENVNVIEESGETETDTPAEGTKKAATKKRASRSKKKTEEVEAADVDTTEE
jgi:trigger factor